MYQQQVIVNQDRRSSSTTSSSSSSKANTYSSKHNNSVNNPSSSSVNVNQIEASMSYGSSSSSSSSAGIAFAMMPTARNDGNSVGPDAHTNTDYEQIFLEYLINEENVRDRLMNRNRVFVYDEAKLRAAAAAVISQQTNNNSHGSSERKRRKTCSSEERVLLNRERNREHAQKTRQRKKVYIAKLKELIVTLTQQITIIKHEFSARGFKINSIQESRKKALYNFMDYRCNGNVNINDWNDIVTNNITVILPITPYRYYPQQEVLKTEKYRRYLSGLDALINDIHSTEIMMSSFLEGTLQWRCSFGYMFKFVTSKVSLMEVLCGESTVTAKFSETLSFARETNVPPLTYHGFVTCRFNPQNKIIFAELNFDSMGYYAQLQGITNSALSIAIPNTVELATKSSYQPRAVISAEGPDYQMIYCNDKWIVEAGGHEQKVGRSIFDNLNLLNANESQNLVVLFSKCCAGIPCSTIISCKDNSSEDKKSYRSVYLKATPLSKSSNSIMSRLSKGNGISNILLVQYVLTINVQPDTINDALFEGDTGDLDLDLFL